MGVIKSAIEIAMENSKSIEANKELVEANQAAGRGKKLVWKVLENAAFDARRRSKAMTGAGPSGQRGFLSSPCLPTWCSPRMSSQCGTPSASGKPSPMPSRTTRKVTMIFSQLDGFFKEYIGERKRLAEAVERQYAPRLKKKEEEMSRQMGRQVKINPAPTPSTSP